MKNVITRAALIFASTIALALPSPAEPAFAQLEAQFNERIKPLVGRYCLDCHDTATSEGELDLERFHDLASVRADPKIWQQVVHQIEIGEMPPKDDKEIAQLTRDDKAALLGWAKGYLRAEALSQAGDPGPVVLRRLSNAEYTYTLRDLTGVDTLEPAREFPVDSAAGEGFTNAGGALVMSPALFEKYLEAGKGISKHAVLLPDGFRFSNSTTRADHANEILEELRSIYLETTGGSGINFAYTSQVRSAAPEGAGEGRLNLTPYLATLITHREALARSPETITTIAADAGLNAKYLATLARALIGNPEAPSFLLDHFRERFSALKPADAPALAAEIRAWQDQLWKFNNVGHLGLIRPWQEAVSPVTSRREISLELEPGTTEIHLAARGVGTPSGKVRWSQPRIERPGSQPILLRDLERGFARLTKLRAATLRNTTRYLGAAAEVQAAGEEANLPAIASKHGLNETLLKAWNTYLGFSRGSVLIESYLAKRVPRVGGYDFVNGWTLAGVADYSLLGNSSDQAVRIPGDLQPHKVVVHPRPERWIAAGWMSPFDGWIDISAHVRDAHGTCGNGVSWSVDMRRGNLTRILRSDNLELGQTAEIETVRGMNVRKGDLVSIVIGARDNNHACDLTEIDLEVAERGGEKRSWSLSKDCADNMQAGNPHADRHGRGGVWHFYGGLNEKRKESPGVVPGSMLESWLDAQSPAQSAELARKLEQFLMAPLAANVPEPDRALHEQLTSLNGPLFSALDFGILASEGDVPVREGFEDDGSLVADISSQLTFTIPAALAEGATFVTSGRIADGGSGTTVAQLHAGTSAPTASRSLQAGAPLVVADTEDARQALEQSFAAFRALFPAAMCYARVVPADEVVTMLLYHREDEPLRRLMLNDEQSARLDQLWDQLIYVSREPERLVTSYEQIWQFATQDADPTRFEPMEAAIRERASRFRKTLAAAEPTHLDALVKFAPRVYRRPLAPDESAAVRALYQRLREEKLSHEAAFSLTLARLFSAAAFLYKTEVPSQNPGQGPVSSWELATRLSYFLTSSAPDETLARSALSGSLTRDSAIIEQTRRLLRGPHSRRLAIEFGCQWLHVRNFDQHDEKNESLYPEFGNLRGRMYEESIRFFTDFFQHDRSILSLLDANHTFADPELARFYGLPEHENGWRRIEDTRKSGRGGILAMATTLARQSGASRTSPILRGNWVSETLLGEKLPKPPKGVPTLPDELPEGLSERELILRHSSDPACAKCHERIDQYGFTLENYDAIGRLRTGRDTSASLPDGTTLAGIEGLRRYLLEDRRETFVRHFCQKLLGYALGREVQLSDQPFLDDLMAKLESNDYRVGTAIEAIVLSPQFREIRGGHENKNR